MYEPATAESAAQATSARGVTHTAPTTGSNSIAMTAYWCKYFFPQVLATFCLYSAFTSALASFHSFLAFFIETFFAF